MTEPKNLHEDGKFHIMGAKTADPVKQARFIELMKEAIALVRTTEVEAAVCYAYKDPTKDGHNAAFANCGPQNQLFALATEVGYVMTKDEWTGAPLMAGISNGAQGNLGQSTEAKEEDFLYGDNNKDA